MYLMRLDDASEYWNKDKWIRMHDLLVKYDVKPIVAIIPANEDPKLLPLGKDEDFWDIIQEWIRKDRWTPALHGHRHFLHIAAGGMNQVNQRSEFVGYQLLEQKFKIRNGLENLKNHGIVPEIFVAPCHTFDENTLEALRIESNIRIISDTIADDIYYRYGFYFIPQQSGVVRPLKNRITTFCYHPNFASEEGFNQLENFLHIHHDQFISYQDVQLKKRNLSLYDWILQRLYFCRLRFIKLSHLFTN